MYESEQEYIGNGNYKRMQRPSDSKRRPGEVLTDSFHEDVRIQYKSGRQVPVSPVVQRKPVSADEMVTDFINAMSQEEDEDQKAGLAGLLQKIYEVKDIQAVRQFAGNIRRNFKYENGQLKLGEEIVAIWNGEKYVNINEKFIQVSLKQLIFKYMKDEMILEEENYDRGNHTIIKSVEKINSFKVFYTKRVADEKIRIFNEVCHEVDKSIKNMESRIGKITQEQLQPFFKEAVKRLLKTRKISDKYEEQEYDATADQVWAIMCKAKEKFEKIKITICCDSAGLDSIYGTSDNNNSSPETLMDIPDSQTEISEGKNVITINFDAVSDIQTMKDTLYHEIAHLIGFNPTGAGSSGHFEDVSRYLEKETAKGITEMPKILFDAYFFEVFMSEADTLEQIVSTI